jgi:hypothetical protein
MRQINFKDKESLEKTIRLLEDDANKLKTKLDKSFKYDFLNFVHWDMEDLILLKCAIKVLGEILERAYMSPNDYDNTFEEFVVYNLVNIAPEDDIRRYELSVWQTIYKQIEFINIK